MKKQSIIVKLISCAVISMCILATVSEGAAKKMDVVLLGDSIRMGYQGEVRKNLAGKANVWSPRENCQDSAFFIKNIAKWLKGKNPDIIYMNCGLHDMFLGSTGKCRRSAEDYGKNLDLIFSKIKTLCPNATIVFALTTPVDEEKQKTSKTYGRLVRRNSDIKAYNITAVEITGKAKVKTDDINIIMMQAGVKELIVSDGIHLSKKAKVLLGKHIANIIQETAQQRKTQ